MNHSPMAIGPRLRRRAGVREERSHGQHVRFITEVRVVPSCRRFDQWPLFRTLVQTNPVYIALFRRRPSAWRGWYGDVPR